MGAKQTKIDGCYLPSTPITQCPTSEFIDMNLDVDNEMDPRSPTGCRTPICLQNNRLDTNAQMHCFGMNERDPNKEKSLDLLRRRFLRGFAFNINDPRSPSLHLNRTPLVFEDNVEKSLNLDDTFADLFVESRLSCPLNSEKLPANAAKDNNDQGSDIEMPEEKVIIELEESTHTPHTSISLQQQIDPRSPSIGVERTPIIFTDDEADRSNEDVMLERILDTLSLNLNTSGDSSEVSIISQSVHVNLNGKYNLQVPPVNKHLDRVRAAKKSSSKPKNFETRRLLSQQKIYEDQENMPTTLKCSSKNDSVKSKRTPLSCVRNRNGSHLRSRSVESSAKSIKTRLALTSFDDAFNPNENKNVHNFRLLHQGSHESLEH